MAFIVSPAIPPALHGKEAAGLAHAVDWAPTLLRIAGVGVNSSGGVLLHGIDGLDMVRLSRPILLDVSEPLYGFSDDLSTIWVSLHLSCCCCPADQQQQSILLLPAVLVVWPSSEL